MEKRKGQLLVGAMLLVAVLAIIIPIMVMYVQNEAKWSVKQGQNSNAFQLAEGALDRGYQKVIESTQSWKTVQAGTPLPNMSLNYAFNDLSGGTYAVSVTSGPNTGEVTIVGVGRDKMNKEVRALKAVYVNSLMSDISIAAANGVSMNGNGIQVEWGAITSPKELNMYGKLHPSYWSEVGIKNGAGYVDTNGAAKPNCDSPNCWWWHTYYKDLPPMPEIDFAAYKSSATGTDPCGNNYYQPASVANFSGNCTSNATPGHTYYIEGNWVGFKTAMTGNIIVKGSLTYSNGSQPSIAENAVVPPTAWKQYCNDWDYYLHTFDAPLHTLYPAGPPCMGSLNSSYRANVTYPISAGIHGFVYIGGNFTIPNGGGGSDLIHGAIVVNGLADIQCNSSGCRIYYDPIVAAGIITTGINLVRESWQDTTTQWPGGLP